MSGNFKVIIAGGSIAGLAQALMLEKNGIDFLVLEAYSEIAPQAGASIGLLPNGLRILDQLGCYDAVMKLAQTPVQNVYSRRSTGETFWSMENFSTKSIDRHGYPIIFLDRQMVIQTLYDHIQDKSKVLPRKRVVSVKQSENNVRVETEDGSIYSGDIVLGADGIHSTVRQQMWDSARNLEPEWMIPSENTALPATYACIFGISTSVPGIQSGSLHSVYNEHFSYLVPGGPGDRCYWFLVWNMGKTYYGSDIPRFTKNDEEDIAKKHWDDAITPDICFSDLYSSKIASVCTPLAEYVYKKWYFRRIMTIGDSSHKFEPISGQGGNNAIETAAALTNYLVSALETTRNNRLSSSEIETVFESTQKLRFTRVQSLVNESHKRQRIEAMETPLLKAFATYVLPVLGVEKVYQSWARSYCSAVSLESLPIPPKPRQVLYTDEIVYTPKDRRAISFILSLGLGTLTGLTYYFLIYI